MNGLTEVLNGLGALGGRGMKFGVERTRAILDELGSPDKKLKIIHIAGTNGKGSVAEYITQILIAAGKRTGTFTSPAVYDYFEQFRVDGKPIESGLFVSAFGKAVKAGADATRFEAETAGSVYAFALAGCEYAVLECGMGGLNDATNAVAQKEIAVITSIGLEHTAYLGDSLEAIAAQKAGIIKDCPAVVEGYQREAVEKYFKKLNVIFAEPVQSAGERAFIYGGRRYEVSMNGRVQHYNAAAAAEAARQLKIDENAIYAGIKRATLPARNEVINAFGNTYILDGAHNPSAVAAFADFIEEKFGGADVIIWGSLSDKDIDQNIYLVSGLAGRVCAVRPDSPRAMDAEKVKAVCIKYGVKCSVEEMSSALENARGVVAVCGSFTLYEEAKKWIERRL